MEGSSKATFTVREQFVLDEYEMQWILEAMEDQERNLDKHHRKSRGVPIMTNGQYRVYDLNTYNHRQFWRLVRDLTSSGWTVTIKANEERRPPWKMPEGSDAYECRACNPGFDIPRNVMRSATTAWSALTKAVTEIVEPAVQCARDSAEG